jgi:hypothetical protein
LGLEAVEKDERAEDEVGFPLRSRETLLMEMRIAFGNMRMSLRQEKGG